MEELLDQYENHPLKLKNFDKDFGVNHSVFANQIKGLLLLKIFAKSSKTLKT